MRRYLLGSLLYALSVFPALAEEASVPVWWESVLGYTQLPVGRMQETLQKACELITTKSLKPVTASELAFESVKSLSTIDQKINVMKDGKRVLILADGKILKSFRSPEDTDCANWTRLMLAAAIEARPFSPKAQQADAEEFFNIFLNASLGIIDSYSHYIGLDPAEPISLKNPASIGISYRRIGKYLEITEIIPDGSASHSDLAVADRISAINGKAVKDLSRIEVLNLLRGEEGSEVFLTLRKDGKTQQRTLKRTKVSASPVTYYFDEKNKIMTIKISGFTAKTVTGLKATLYRAKNLKAAGLIIDLRSNTGGLLKEAVLAADLFLPEDLLMIKTKGRIAETEQQYTSTPKENRPVYPIVILTDSKTASSAEFFAGVLQEYRHAVIVGTPTYGKGVIQANDSLPDGGQLYLTWAQFYLPSGYSPQTYGIYPNICSSGITLLTLDKVPAAQTQLKPWRTGTKAFKQKALQFCPPEVRKDNPADDEIAKQLLLDPDRYVRSLSYFSLDSERK